MKSPLASLLLLIPGYLSCSFLSGDPSTLAPVAAAPAIERPAPAPAPALDAPPASDPRVASVARFLEKRRTGLTRREVARLSRVIVREAERHDFEPRLVMAVIAVESGFYNFAVSHVGAMGLMQLMPATGEELALQMDIHWRGEQTLFDPESNIRMGVAYLRWLTNRFGDVSTALAAYNWGPGHIDRRIRRGTPLPQRYARLVLEKYDEHSETGTSS